MTDRSGPLSAPRTGLALLCGTFLLVGACAWADPTPLKTADPTEGPAVPYAMTLAGVPEGDLREMLLSSSSLWTLREEPPPGLPGLQRRADADRERLIAALRSLGHYNATLSITVDPAATPAKVAVTVDPGPLYRIGQVRIEAAPGVVLTGAPITPKDIGLTTGEPARSADVVGAEGRLVDLWRGRGYAFAKVPDRKAVVDHRAQTMDVRYGVDPGPAVYYGTLAVDGVEKVGPDLIRDRIPWQPGDRFNPDDFDAARTKVVQLGVFSAVDFELADRPDSSGRYPVTVRVAERKRRFIGAGVEFSSSEGLGLNAFWGHRNLFGGGERLRLEGGVQRLNAGKVTGDPLGKTDINLSAEFAKPDFLTVDQTLVARTEILTEHPLAYDRQALVGSVALERRMNNQILLGYGVAVEQQRIREAVRTTRSLLVGLPLTASYDSSDDPLNPTKGVRLLAAITPWSQFGDTGGLFTVNRFTGTGYYDFGSAGSYVLAGRASVGFTFDDQVRDVPADKRFYAGGGGSVRGYGFQRVGPVNADGDPSGGLSLVEFGAELRVKVTDSIGVVPFLDAGAVYETLYPDFEEPLRLGAGLGLRYYTGFGPVRLDVAVPLNKRDTDDAWQLYISFGQAF